MEQSLQYASKKQKVLGRPIIIVPSAVTSMITLDNVGTFLEQGVFKVGDLNKPAEKRQKSLCIVRSSSVDESHKVKFDVFDSIRAEKFSENDWDRVVAVFVTGQLWQFSNWKYQVPAIFEKVAAFHLKYDEDMTNENVKNWRVSVLSINKSKRHMDSSAMFTFWNKVIEDIAAKKKPVDY